MSAIPGLNDRIEAAYQVAKLTSSSQQTIRDMLLADGVHADIVELIVHSLYTLAYLDGMSAGLRSAIETTGVAP